ncbi:hypothetical protein RGF97_04735 [Streptomyces roseicoloratus]|uniref:Integral membrane protein n=1 Tax=Streptomyces roseicoloratus TaxID=2508722 RepID=A0ABY9RS36_9ACTN|nr:hypothetical protein [Streptomyces roseicoloratus]WMX44296.1 hypothetical protein RGF97_04735 [Streptomyces roseicoloratus]
MRNWMFGGIYGTVLASALLAALQSEGEPFTPVYDALWILVTGIAAGLVHGYAHHMATHHTGSAAVRWKRLVTALGDEWPLVVGVLPTVALLLLAGAADWPEETVTTAGLALNTLLLGGWGTFAALRSGYRRGSAVLVGLADATIGLAIAVANALIK